MEFLRTLWQKITGKGTDPSVPVVREAAAPLILTKALGGRLESLSELQERPQQEVFEDLLSYALLKHDGDARKMERWLSLTQREQQVAAFCAMNYTNQEIGKHLSISPETVKSHVRNIVRKFGLHRKVELRLLLSDWDFTAWEKDPDN